MNKDANGPNGIPYRDSIPPLVFESLVRYAEVHARPGGFTCAVLANDLQTAISYADPESLAAIKSICAFVKWELPALSWGSYKKVDSWISCDSVQ